MLLNARFLIVMVLGLAACRGCGGADVVATVGDHEVTRDELRWEQAVGRTRTPEQTLARLVERTLMAEGAKREKLHERPEIRARLVAAERDVLAQVLLDSHLESGTSDAVLRERFEKVKDSLRSRRVHVRQIAIRVEPALSTEAVQAAARAALTRAESIHTRLKGGEDFASVAKDASDDAPTAAQGGLMEPINDGQVNKEFFEAAFLLKKGEISPPTPTSFGFHIIRAEEDPQLLAPVFDQVKGQLAAQVRRELEAKLLETLKKDIPVKPGETP